VEIWKIFTSNVGKFRDYLKVEKNGFLRETTDYNDSFDYVLIEI